MRYPSVFVNHGGGPMPLLGSQPDIVHHFHDVKTKFLPKEPPKAIVVVSAHFESNPIRITSAAQPPMLYDYGGFPPESYKIQYPAPGSPDLAKRIQSLLNDHGISSQLDDKRGYDHGAFVPIKLMYPEANIPVVEVSLHSSLNADRHVQLGKALSTLSDDGILLLGSGYTFHNMNAFFNPTPQTKKASTSFNQWLKSTILSAGADGNTKQQLQQQQEKEEGEKKEKDQLTCSINNDDDDDDSNNNNNTPKQVEKLASLEKAFQQWDKVGPGARVSHPREEHLLPLFVVAAAAAASTTTPFQPQVVYESDQGFDGHLITGYRFA